jgi:hypothetical protein
MAAVEKMVAAQERGLEAAEARAAVVRCVRSKLLESSARAPLKGGEGEGALSAVLSQWRRIGQELENLLAAQEGLDRLDATEMMQMQVTVMAVVAKGGEALEAAVVAEVQRRWRQMNEAAMMAEHEVKEEKLRAEVIRPAMAALLAGEAEELDEVACDWICADAVKRLESGAGGSEENGKMAVQEAVAAWRQRLDVQAAVTETSYQIQKEQSVWDTKANQSGVVGDVLAFDPTSLQHHETARGPGVVIASLGRQDTPNRLNERIRVLEEEANARAPPAYWDKVTAEKAADGFAAIALNRTDPTFAALGRFLETDKVKLAKWGADRTGTSHDTLKLACAWRLENPTQWGKYMSGVQEAEKDMERIRQAGVKPAGGAPVMTGVVASDLPGQLRANVNEAFLMHGTGMDVLINILSNGMNERFAGASAGTQYGEGSYLAEDAGKIDHYTKVDQQYDGSSELHKRLYAHGARHQGKVFYVLVCRVALGHHVRTKDVGRKAKSIDTGRPVFPISFRELDTVAGVSPPVHHHSLLADVSPPMRYREFIVFHSEYIYPEYLLAYQRYEGDRGPIA